MGERIRLADADWALIDRSDRPNGRAVAGRRAT